MTSEDPGPRITRARLTPYRLRLRRPWTSATGVVRARSGWLLRFESANGDCGYGDCAPLPAAGTEPAPQALEQLHAWRRHAEGQTTGAALRALSTRAVRTPAARCAIETALLDLWAQHQRLPLARWLVSDPRAQVHVNAAVGALDGGIEQRLRAALAAGYQVLKVKVAVHALEPELRHLQTLTTLPAGVWLRLDANRGWSSQQAWQALGKLQGLPIESIEEPLERWDPRQLRPLQRSVAWPLAIDESLPGWLLHHPVGALPVRRLVLKPSVLGGLLPALRIARSAARSGRRCVVTTTLDSAAGVWAALHLAAAVDAVSPPSPTLRPAHGLATASWLEQDMGPAPQIALGTMSLPRRPGTGFEPGPELDLDD